MSDFDYKIQKYTFKLKHATNNNKAKIYNDKIKYYKKEQLHKKQQGGNNEVNDIINASKSALNDKISENKIFPVYDKKKVNAFTEDLKNEIGNTIKQYNDLVKEKDELCKNTMDLSDQIKKLKSEHMGDALNSRTEELLNNKKFVETICAKHLQNPQKIIQNPFMINAYTDDNLNIIQIKINEYINKIVPKIKNKNYVLSTEDKKDFIKIIQLLREFIADEKNLLKDANVKSLAVRDVLSKLFSIDHINKFFLSDEFKFSLIDEPELWNCSKNCTTKVTTLFEKTGTDVRDKIAKSFMTYVS